MVRRRYVQDERAPRTWTLPGEAIPGPPSWMNDALCATIDADLWFPDIGARNQQKLAISICHRCPVMQACLEESLSSAHSVYGIWGGVGEKKRLALRAARRKATALLLTQPERNDHA